MARRFVEERHEAKLSQRVVDVRPAGTQYAEWLTERFNLLMVVIPMLLLALVLPMAAPIMLLVGLGHVLVHVNAKTVLPFRYPACNPEPDPDPKNKKKKRGEGILYFGSVDSDSDYEKFKEVWLSDDDLRKHMLIIGSTGSGKSETLKGIFFNALCWSSGFFIADGKADNKLPTDVFMLVRSMGRDDDLLFLNFLLGGKTPEQVRRSRRRRTNKLNPVATADADTIIQMGANMLPKVEGEGKNWQEKALNLWRAVIQALCYLRDNEGTDLSIASIIEYLALPKVEELYIRGYEEAQIRGEWSYGFAGIKSYLDSGCPAYKVDRLLAKHGYSDEPEDPMKGMMAVQLGGRGAAAGGKPKSTEQDSMAFEQHAYRTSQLMPVLNLLDKTYGFIFRDKYPEIDMIDVALNNRILVMLIPSLEKSSAEAENLGKLAIACLRVMMGKNLGSEIEGSARELLDSKATNAPYPFLVALDELAYYFSDGIAVMFAQARSLGMCMIAACQDLEKLTEGSRAAEAGAMLANQVAKLFMRIDDAKKTFEFMNSILGKVTVAVRRSFELGTVGYKRQKDIDIVTEDRVPLTELQSKGAGEGVFNSSGKTIRTNSLYVGNDLKDHRGARFFVLRFLEVEPPTDDEIDAHSIAVEEVDDPVARGSRLVAMLRHQVSRTGQEPPLDPVISSAAMAAQTIGQYVRAPERAIALYMAARNAAVAMHGHPLEQPADASRAQLPEHGGEAGRSPAGQEEGIDLDALFAGEAAANDAPPVSQPEPEQVRPVARPAQTPRQERREDQAQAPAGADGAAELLSFLGLGEPFERKSSDQLLSGDEPIRDDRKHERDILLDEAGEQDSAEPEAPDSSDILRSIMATGKFLTLRRASQQQRLDAAARAHASPNAPNAPLRAVVPSASILPGGARGGRPAFDPSINDGGTWIEAALAAPRPGPRPTQPSTPHPAPKTVVGFADETMAQVVAIEQVLGSADPERAARRLEVVVSDQVTPPASSSAPVLSSMDDIDLLFDAIQSKEPTT